MGHNVFHQRGIDAARQKGAREATKEAEAAEKAAKIEMANALIAREMPDDLRARAKAWGVEAFMDVVWLNAYGRGYCAAIRDVEQNKPET